MSHITVKLWPGRDEEVKTALAEKIAQDVAEGLNVNIGDVSVAFEEVEKEDWGEKVYKKEIRDNIENIYLKPTYKYN